MIALVGYLRKQSNWSLNCKELVKRLSVIANMIIFLIIRPEAPISLKCEEV